MKQYKSIGVLRASFTTMHFFKACLRNNIMTPVLVCLVRCHAQLSEGLRTGLVEHWNVNTFKSQKMRFFFLAGFDPFPGRQTRVPHWFEVWMAKKLPNMFTGPEVGRDVAATISPQRFLQFPMGNFQMAPIPDCDNLQWRCTVSWTTSPWQSWCTPAALSSTPTNPWRCCLWKGWERQLAAWGTCEYGCTAHPLHNLWKLWRRSIPAFSRSAWCPCPWRVLGRTSQSTGSGLRVATGSHRPDVLLASPMVPIHGPAPYLGPWHLDLAPPAPSSVRTGAGQHVGADRRSRRLASPRGGAPTRLRRIVPTYKPFNMPRFCPEKM